MNILYIHGLASSGDSSTAKNLRLLLPEATIIAPDLPVDPHLALAMLRKICIEEQPDNIIGTSMGGLFAQKLRGYKKILVNPAFHVSRFMRKNMGIQTFLNPRKDGVHHFVITRELCDEYEKIESEQFNAIDDKEKLLTWALFGTNDTLVNCQEEYRRYYTPCDPSRIGLIQSKSFEGGHRLNRQIIINEIIPLLK